MNVGPQHGPRENWIMMRKLLETLTAVTVACCVAFTTAGIAVTMFFGLMTPII
jgi:hypothetical protein